MNTTPFGSLEKTMNDQRTPIGQFFKPTEQVRVRDFVRELPNGIWEGAKTLPQQVIRFGISAVEAPQIMRSGKITPKFYTTPFGRLNSIQSEFQNRTDMGQSFPKAFGHAVLDTAFGAGDALAVAKPILGVAKNFNHFGRIGEEIRALAGDMTVPLGKTMKQVIPPRIESVSPNIFDKFPEQGTFKNRTKIKGFDYGRNKIPTQIPAQSVDVPFEFQSKLLGRPGLSIKAIPKPSPQEGRYSFKNLSTEELQAKYQKLINENNKRPQEEFKPLLDEIVARGVSPQYVDDITKQKLAAGEKNWNKIFNKVSPLQEGGQKTYKIIKQEGIRETKGTPVKIVDGVDTFIHKGTGGWVVSESSTGRYLADSGSINTKESAIKNARLKIKSVGIDEFKKVISENQLPQPQGITPINTKKFNISKKAQKNLDETVTAIKPELEKIKGGVLKNEDVIDAARASKILSRDVGIEQTKRTTAAITRLREEVAAGAEGKGLTKDFIENLKVLKSYSTDAGRKLQAFNIQASPETSIKESVVADLVALGKKSDEILSAAKGVDFDNPKQVTEFYRQFVKPSMGQIIDEYRYINLLSSPRTHIVNAFSNLIQGTVLNPATKLYSGGVDIIGSALTGKARTHYIGEVPAYTKGFVNSIGDAFKEAAQVFKGNKFVERPDINRIPTGKLGAGDYVLRALEAGDVFFRKMIKGGEIESLLYKAQQSGKKVPMSVIEKQAADAAEYFVFRKVLDSSNKTGQGVVLSGIDKMTEAVYKLRKVPGVNWLVPFVQTPMNILKQGIEYSPTGLTTLVGNTNKTAQIAKSLLGSTVLAGAGMVAAKGDSTWAVPIGVKEKAEFYAAGRKPYSIKIGDNWYSYSKLGPLAYPIAMAAAVKWNFEQDPKATSTDLTDKTTKALAGVAGFMADQSYLTGLGDLLDIARGDEYSIKKALANFGRQTIPLASLQGWIARQIDPVFRQGKTMGEQIESGTPLLSKKLDPYLDPLGNESVRQNNTFNSFSPIEVTPANQQFEDIYQKRQETKRSMAEAKSLTEGTKTLSNGKVAVVIDKEAKTFDTKELADRAVAKNKLLSSDKSSMKVEGGYLRKSESGDTATFISDNKYNEGLYTNKLSSLKRTDNVSEWLKVAEKKFEVLQAQLDDPNTDELDKGDIQEKMDILSEQYIKYRGYGGFTKPKKGKAPKKVAPIKLNFSKLSVPKPLKISSPKISALPKTIKLSKPKRLSIKKPTYRKSVAPIQGKRLA